MNFEWVKDPRKLLNDAADIFKSKAETGTTLDQALIEASGNASHPEAKSLSEKCEGFVAARKAVIEAAGKRVVEGATELSGKVEHVHNYVINSVDQGVALLKNAAARVKSTVEG